MYGFPEGRKGSSIFIHYCDHAGAQTQVRLILSVDVNGRHVQVGRRGKNDARQRRRPRANVTFA